MGPIQPLERMGVDHVDLIQLHNLTDQAGWEEAMSADGALAEILADEGVDVTFVETLKGRQTVLCVVVTDKAGQHVFLGIKDDKPPEHCPPSWKEIVPQARSLFTNGYTLRDLLNPHDVLDLLEIARKQKIPIFFDPGPSIEYFGDDILTQVLKLTDILLLTIEEAKYLVNDKGAKAAIALRTSASSCCT